MIFKQIYLTNRCVLSRGSIGNEKVLHTSQNFKETPFWCVCVCMSYLCVGGTVGIFYSPTNGVCYFMNYDYKVGGARGVMVIVAGNGHSDVSSNPGRD